MAPSHVEGPVLSGIVHYLMPPLRPHNMAQVGLRPISLKWQSRSRACQSAQLQRHVSCTIFKLARRSHLLPPSQKCQPLTHLLVLWPLLLGGPSAYTNPQTFSILSELTVLPSGMPPATSLPPLPSRPP